MNLQLPGGPPSMFSNVDGGRSRNSSSSASQEPSSTFLSVGGGRSCIFSFGTSQGVRSRHFLMLMVGASGSLAPALPRGSAIDVF
jgi:hypothetical protein